MGEARKLYWQDCQELCGHAKDFLKSLLKEYIGNPRRVFRRWVLMGSNMHFKGSFTFGQKIEGEEDWVE